MYRFRHAGLGRSGNSITITFIAFLLCIIIFSVNASAQFTIRGDGRYNNSPIKLMDRKSAEPGAAWNSDLCVWWTDDKTAFVASGGEVRTVNSIRLQVDGNDTYKVDYSLDGETWTRLITILPEYGSPDTGMETFNTLEGENGYVKEIAFQPAKFLYLRLSAEGGDGQFAAAEWRIYSSLDEQN